MLKETPLRKWRLDNRLTLAAVAKDADISKAHLCEIELGRKTPSVLVARRLSDRTGLSLDEVLRQ